NEPSGRTSLPRLKIYSFSGTFEDWPTCRDIFQSIVGDNSSISAVEKIDRPIGSPYGFDLLNYLVIELFDPKIRLEWESLSSASTDVPTHEALMDFITKRALTLNAAKPKSLKVSEDPPRSAKSHHVKRHTESPQCVLCKGKHHVIVCKKFKEKSAVDRKAVAETHRLCFNCLGSHPIAKCQSTRMCITCPLLANVLLRWRRHRYAFVTDIEKMYRQILVNPEDQKAKRRQGTNKDIPEQRTRLRFWIPRSRAVVKRLALHQCVTCTRVTWKAATPQPPMGSLPPGRVTPAQPFLRVGIDYAGPIFIRTIKGRGHSAHKAFIAIFAYFSSKAVHLEAVSDYTTDAFLAALRRFTSHRGLCSDIYSDCGTNFSGADRQLREMLFSSEGIRWHFNPPSAPHFGGLWEAAVKSAKYHLRRTIGDSRLTFEEMSTLLAQVEACMNSRPMHALSDDSDDLTVLTQDHLLIGAIPEPSLAEDKTNLISRWQLIQRMRDHFWSCEYLHTLATRPKWVTIGSLCLIRSEIAPSNKWPLARITQLHPRDDGVMRVVTLKTASSKLIRPLIKLVLLPEDANAVSSLENAPAEKKSGE
ncbi:hypothetical protein ALC56_07192, partial [Trachymyrmex septentrionalis]